VREQPYPSDTKAKGWRLELDMEQFRQSDTWALASQTSRPWLLMLWAVAWEQVPCGSLPNDDELIAARLGIDVESFSEMKRVLLRNWWLAEDGRFYHDVMVSRVNAMLEKKAKDRDRKSGWRTRQSNGVTTESRVTDVGRTVDSTVSDDTKHQAPSTSNTSSLRSDVARKPRATKRCPADFVVTDEMAEAARAECPGLDLNRETTKFRDHEFKQAHSDWAATWRNWMRNAFERMPNVRGSPPSETAYQRSMRERVAQAAGSMAHIVAAKPPGQTRPLEPWEEAIENRNQTTAIGMD